MESPRQMFRTFYTLKISFLLYNTSIYFQNSSLSNYFVKKNEMKEKLIELIQNIQGVTTVEPCHISPEEPDELFAIITFDPKIIGQITEKDK